MNDPKAWVRQQLALMFGGALIVCVIIQMLAKAIYSIDIEVSVWFLAVAIGFVGEFGVSREIEKWKSKMYKNANDTKN